ncbi:Eukaryotic translation initiation factor 4 gamma 1 [Microtus ochrogaster]|uniref:Eukaryotic translation initiation factor 4 gamma 1 n=1 Tax=Microtus ochrogaster TaxID=79684 RepID=A0A8J6GTM2_MICOH|nr:Eukaryotic translation initiation factor 4 gamma 1 [Microtus ochrogaster]
MFTPSQPANTSTLAGPSPPSSAASRVQSAAPARPGPATHVYPAGSQYPVQPGAPGFYPGASPTEFGTYAGAYYPAQGVQQFPAGVAPAPVLMNQPPQIAPKKDWKTIQI